MARIMSGGGVFSKLLGGLKSFGSSALGAFSTSLGQAGADRAIGGIFGGDKELSGLDEGTRQRDYMNAAYPGTNPWERLKGSTASIPAVNIAKRQADTSARNTRLQTAANVEAARIHGRAAAVNASATLGSDRGQEISDHIAHGTPLKRGSVSTQRESSTAALRQAKHAGTTAIARTSESVSKARDSLTHQAIALIRAQQVKINRDAYNLNVAKIAETPWYAKVLAMARRSYELEFEGKKPQAKSYDAWLQEWRRALSIGGIAEVGATKIFKLFNLHIAKFIRPRGRVNKNPGRGGSSKKGSPSGLKRGSRAWEDMMADKFPAQ